VAVKQTPASASTLSVYGKLLKVLGEAFLHQRYAILLARRLKERTESLVEINAALTYANKNLQEFGYAASHDLQEPLRMVSLQSQFLQREYGEIFDARANELIEGVIEAAQNMTVLVSDLLMFTGTAHDLEPPEVAVDANLALKSVLSILADAIREHDAVVTLEDLPFVRVLYVHLQQLFQNLLSNALKYRNPEEPPRIQVSAVRSGNKFIFSVADNGIGIDPSYAVQIFGIFKRLHTKEKYTGTGIGLAVCKKIAESYKGRIWVESELGQGSIFRFELPA
jgi:light-regulated signal transduction histidine kinase (bacteriophytochrome)